MKPIYNTEIVIAIRLYQQCSLIFFALVFFISCGQKPPKEIRVIWDNDRAVGISIPQNLMGNHNGNAIENLLKIKVEKGSGTGILGQYSSQEDNIVFTPIVPLTRGLGYEIFFKDALMGKVKVPVADSADAPKLVAVYPTSDTLPENLLKIYLQFSRPMREAGPLQHVTLLDADNDTLQGIFLDLQPSLWNEASTTLTLWLDPGRIKRNLLPNQTLGNPLKKGQRYTLVISNLWKSAQGLPLQQAYTKQFVVSNRDSLSPDPIKWVLQLPTVQTNQALEINLGGPLDYFLLQETIQVMDANKNIVAGKVKVGDKEKSLQFIPVNKWLKGRYSIEAQSILEDLAGNNLNRLFDRDTWANKAKPEKQKFEKFFEIQ